MYTHNHNYFNELTHPLSFFTALLVTTHSLKLSLTWALSRLTCLWESPFGSLSKYSSYFWGRTPYFSRRAGGGFFLLKRVSSFTTPRPSAANAAKVVEMSSLLGLFLALYLNCTWRLLTNRPGTSSIFCPSDSFTALSSSSSSVS